MNSEKAQSLAHISHQVAPLAQCGWQASCWSVGAVRAGSQLLCPQSLASHLSGLVSVTVHKESQRLRKVETLLFGAWCTAMQDYRDGAIWGNKMEVVTMTQDE